jgi:hypothetical protein
MDMTKKKIVAMVTSALTLLCVAPAYAATTQAEEGYSYEFEDDDLLGEAFGADGDVIVLRTGPARTMLLRPRTSFVRELIRTLEDL